MPSLIWGTHRDPTVNTLPPIAGRRRAPQAVGPYASQLLLHLGLRLAELLDSLQPRLDRVKVLGPLPESLLQFIVLQSVLGDLAKRSFNNMHEMDMKFATH